MYISGRRPGPQVLPFFSTYTAYLCFGQVVASGTYKNSRASALGIVASTPYLLHQLSS